AKSPANLDLTRTVRARITDRKPMQMMSVHATNTEVQSINKSPHDMLTDNTFWANTSAISNTVRIPPYSTTATPRQIHPATINDTNTTNIWRIAAINLAPNISHIDFGTIHNI